MKRRTRSRAPSKASVASWLSACTPRCTLAWECVLVTLDGLDHRQRALRRGRTVEIHERLAVHRRDEDREIPPHALDVVGLRDARQCIDVGAPSQQLLQRGGFVHLAGEALLDLLAQLRHGDRDDHVLEERPLQQLLRRVSRSMPRESR